ncbi:L,D-transpeptidase family protein [Nocardioides sp. SR21]|uniref:L,D-transpeptidase family protein n=1 Tax=Nocardioides sp. SR21 TaxID=2919501 RepID=UPI001FA9D9AF|nr:L,D-transpeptidase family protein [Nocardioides sp. SR21]
MLRRILLVATIAALLCSAAFVAGYASQDESSSRPTASGTGGVPTTDPTPTPASTPTTPATEPTREPTAEPTPEPTPKPTREPRLEPGPRLLGPGDHGDDVRDLQARLRQIFWFNTDVTGVYGDVTTTAVRGFQAKREIPVTGEVDQRTLDRLYAMTSVPTDAELHNRGNTPGALDPRCRTGRVLCVDKSSSTLRWVVDGKVLQTLDVRFGASTTPTREGVFHVYLKDAEHVSRLYGSSMPYSMFFSGGQAVHYSSDFASVGYSGASHGCVNVRDYDGLAHLYSQVQVGDTVVVYWS